jgi:hypothetical protein
MRTTIRRAILVLVAAAAATAGTLTAGASVALAETPCNTGTHWDNVTQQCR